MTLATAPLDTAPLDTAPLDTAPLDTTPLATAPSPAPRWREFDLARGLAIAFMVAVHVLEQYATPSVTESLFGQVVEELGGVPAAPVFVFLMGVSLALSRHADPRRQIRRALGLLLLGYALNFLRGSLPLWLGTHLGLIAPDAFAPYSPASLFWLVDILQFAGLALLILVLVRRALPWPPAWLTLAALVALVSPWLWGRMLGAPLPDIVLTLLWGRGGEWVAFPVFPWIAYALCGMSFGAWLAASRHPDQLFRRAAWAGAALLAGGGAVTLTDSAFHLGDYWRTGPAGVVAITGIVLLWLAACRAIVARVPANAVFDRLYAWSAQVTPFYVLHWLIVGWLALAVARHSLGYGGVLATMVGVAAATDLATRLWVRSIHAQACPKAS
jgi:uncharacterized membrane protein